MSSSPKIPAIKFACRTSSGCIMSLSCDEGYVDPELTSTSSVGPNDYMNYTVIMPPTPDNQPYTAVDSSSAKSVGLPSPYGATKRTGRCGGGAGDDDGSGRGGSGKLERRMSVMMMQNKSKLVRTQTGDFNHNRWLLESKGTYGIGNAFWPHDGVYDDDGGMSMSDFMDKPWKPLTRKLRIPAAILSPYRN